MTATDSEYVICPHCGHQHGDAWEWCRAHVQTETCSECGKEFKCWAEYDVTYVSQKVEP